MHLDVVPLDTPAPSRPWRFEGPLVRIGSDPEAEVPLPLPGVLPLHAAIVLEGDAAFLRARGDVAVNGRLVRETRIGDGDLLEIADGVRLRVTLSPASAAAEAPARRRPAHVPLGPARLLHGRAGAALTLVFLAILVGGAYLAARVRPRDDVGSRLAEERSRQERLLAARDRAQTDRLASLKEELLRIEQRMADRAEVDARMGEVKRAVAEVETNVIERVGSEIEASIGRRPEIRAAQDAVLRLEKRDAAAARIIDAYAGGVCLIQGAYGFARTVNGKWRFLREADEELLRNVEISGDRVPLTLAGKGPVFTVEYTGTGFLADASGYVLTNRHIAEPWWKSESAAPLIEDGYTPRFVRLRAFFPGRRDPVDFDLGGTILSDDADLALLRCGSFEGMPAPLPLAPPGAAFAGQRVVLLGYPSGLDALLARGEEDLAIRVSGDERADAGKLLDALAERNLVRPLPTQGHVGDVLEDKILFDAPTAVGGSGGPLIDLEGRVVAVNYGILKAFAGANFGVPVDRAARLLEKTRRK